MPASQIDEQVVKMSFDNSNFDSNINDSIKVLNALQNKLVLFDKNANFDNLTESINRLSNTFTVKGQIMLGVLTRLGKKVYDLGDKAFKKLFKGIKDGMEEYDLLIDSTQTIYENVKQNGKSLNDVMGALDELNEYADKTIYNFSEMTRMIGMFTSAGVGLNNSVKSIKGLANAAALVGANTQKAEMAWRAVSRAMSTGKFTNLTWKTLEQSNIAGKQFQKVILEVARVNKVTDKHGRNIDKMIKKYGSLRESLKEGWLTNDIFNQAMKIMANDMSRAEMKKAGFSKKQINELQEIAKSAEEAATRVKSFKQLVQTTTEAIGSGWAQSFRILIGDLKQARKFYTRISEVLNDFIDNNAKIRNTLFEQIIEGKDKDINGAWKTGQDNFTQIIENMQATVITFLKAVKTGFLNIFPIERISGAARKVLDTIQKFTKALVLNDEETDAKGKKIAGRWDTKSIEKVTESIKDLIRFFRGLAAAIDVAWMAFSQPIKVIFKRIPFFNKFFDNTNEGLVGILKKLGQFGDKITVFQNAIKQTNFFGSLLEILLDNIDELGKKYPVLGAILWIFRSIKKAINDVKNGFKKLNIKPLSTAFGAFKFIVTSLWRGLNALFGLIQNATKKLDFSWLGTAKKFLTNFAKTFSDYGKGLIDFEEIARKVSDKFTIFFNKAKNSATTFFNVVSEKAKSVKESLTNIFNDVKNRINSFTKSVSNGANTVKKKLGVVQDEADETGEKVQTVWDKFKAFFGSLSENIKKLFSSGDNSLEGIAKKIIIIASSIGAASLGISHFSKTLEKLKIYSNINSLLKAGLNVVKAYQKEAQSKMILNIAIAIGILAASMVALSFVPYDKLENGLVIFASFMATLMLTLTPLINAIALLNKAIAAKQNGNPINVFIKTLGEFGKKLAKGFNAKAFGKACIYFAVSVGIIVAAIIALKKTFTNLDEIEKPLNAVMQLMLTIAISMGAISVALTIISKITPKAKAVVSIFSGFFQLVGISHVIISIALAVAILSQSLIALSKVDYEKTLPMVGLIGAIIAAIGLIAIGIGIIIAQAKSFNKLKDIAITLVAASGMLAIALGAFIALMKLMDSTNSDSWINAVLSYSVIVSGLVVLTGVLLSLSKKVGGKAEYWKQLNKFLVFLTACLVSLAGGMYILAHAGKIDDSVIQVISILTSAAAGVFILIGILSAISNTTFSTNFIKVIQGISVAISAFVAAVGILALGLTSLINAIMSIDITGKKAKNTSNAFLEKIEYVAEVISDSIPALKNLFYKVGQAFAEVFSSFVVGFLDKIIEVGDQYTRVIDKVINLLIDIIGKIVNVLYTRKSEVIGIFNKVADLIVSLFTNALNQAFRRGENETPIKESTVAKFLGIGAFISVANTFASKFNTMYTFVKNQADSTAKVLNKINRKLLKETDETTKLTGKDYTIMALAVTAALKSASLAAKGLRQLSGKESRYVRNDLVTTWDKIAAFFTDAEYRAQQIMWFMAAVGRVIINLVVSLGAIILGPFYTIFRLLMKALSLIPGAIADIATNIGNLVSNITGKATPSIDKFAKKCEDFTKSIYNFGSIPWSKYWETGFGGWKNVFNFQLGDPAAAESAGAEDARAYANGYANAMDTATVNYMSNISSKGRNGIMKAASGALGEVSKYVEGTTSHVFDKAKTTATKEVDAFVKDVSQGAKNSIDKYGGQLNKSLEGVAVQGKEMLNKVWQRHSPSKVTEAVYRDVVMGGVVGVKKNKGKLSKEMAQMLKEQNATIKAGTGAMTDAIMQSLGIERMSDRIKQLKVDIVSQDPGYLKENGYVKQTVTLNEDYLRILESQKEALVGRNRESAVAYMTEQVRTRGLMIDTVQIGQLIDAVLTQTDQHTQVTMDQMEALTLKTTQSVEDVVGRDVAAQQLVIDDAINNYNEMMNLANDHADSLINKKKEEVQEYLYQEGLKRGMTEETAKLMSEAVTAELFKGKTKNEVLTKEELLNKIDAYKKDYEDFKRTEEAKTTLLSEMAKMRATIESNEYYKKLEQMRTGQITAGEFQAWARTKEAQQAMKDYNTYKNSYDKSSRAYYDYMNETRKDLIDKGLHTEESLKKAEEEAKRILGEAASANRGDYTSLFQKIKDLLNIKAPGINLDNWNKKNDNDKNKKNKYDEDAVKAAKDTKKALEAQRADLTPTIDLDKLSDEAKKANGIVTSSLMAAQNASIGDYINKDSELNPFMKDRWQNVYNFTQNNYSPKALSRTDIYRQTQRQLNLSRGF